MLECEKAAVIMTEGNLSRRVLVTKELKDGIEAEVSRTVQAAGGNNIINAKYVREIAKAINSSEEGSFSTFKSRLDFPDDDPTWNKALCLAVSFLRRYKMDTTLSAMKDEGAILPKQTGFQKASDVNRAFKEFSKVSENLGTVTFRDRVEEFYDPKPKNSDAQSGKDM